MRLKGHQLECGNCLDVMKTLPDRSVDMVLCDLPYGITQNKWDSVIPLPELWGCYRRILKPKGAVVLTASQPFTSALVSSNYPWFKYSWVWRKSCPTGHLNVKRMPMKEHEDIVVFSSSNHLYNPQGLKPYGKMKRRYSGNGQVKQGDNYGVAGAESFQEVTGYPKTILEIASDRSKQHPTQKPVALFEYLIRTYTNPSNVVLDNCCGSGTTGVACVNTGRLSIQIELSPDYYAIARDRLFEALTAKESTRG